MTPLFSRTKVVLAAFFDSQEQINQMNETFLTMGHQVNILNQQFVQRCIEDQSQQKGNRQLDELKSQLLKANEAVLRYQGLQKKAEISFEQTERDTDLLKSSFQVLYLGTPSVLTFIHYLTSRKVRVYCEKISRMLSIAFQREESNVLKITRRSGAKL